MDDNRNAGHFGGEPAEKPGFGGMRVDNGIASPFDPPDEPVQRGQIAEWMHIPAERRFGTDCHILRGLRHIRLIGIPAHQERDVEIPRL